MVVVDGVRYRPEDAPQRPKRADTDTDTGTGGGEVEHKARTPRKADRKQGK